MLPCTQQLTSPSVSLLGKKEGCCHHFVLKSYFPVDPAVLICTAALQQDPSTIKVSSACVSLKNSSNILSCVFLEVKAKFCGKNQIPPSWSLPHLPWYKTDPSTTHFFLTHYRELNGGSVSTAKATSVLKGLPEDGLQEGWNAITLIC